MARGDSRERILDAAERLFAEKGVGGASLREIGAAAGANPGSLYFHWKVKAELVRDVFRRRLEPLDAERMRRLEAAENAAAPAPAPLEAVLEALISPMFALVERGERGGAAFLRLLGRTYNEPDRTLVRMLHRDHGATVERFREALGRALPELQSEQLAVRFHFALGALAHTLASDASWQLVVGRRPGSRSQWLRELVPFLVAGFGAPPGSREREGERTRGAA